MYMYMWHMFNLTQMQRGVRQGESKSQSQRDTPETPGWGYQCPQSENMVKKNEEKNERLECVKVSGGVCIICLQVSCMHFMHLLLCMHTHSLSSLSLSLLSLSLISFSLYRYTRLVFSLSLKPQVKFPLPYADLSDFLSVFLRCFASVLLQLSANVKLGEMMRVVLEIWGDRFDS